MPGALIAFPSPELAQEVQGTGASVLSAGGLRGPRAALSSFSYLLFHSLSPSFVHTVYRNWGNGGQGRGAPALPGMTFEWEQRAMKKHLL